MNNRPSVAIVGGGPAGLMAAEQLAAAGAFVTVYEQTRSVGRKFLLAGRGGLNITHNEAFDDFVARYGPEAPLLEASLRAFSPTNLREWCAGHDQETYVGTSGRVFPRATRATPLLRSWLQRLSDAGVVIQTQHRWTGWASDGSLTFDGAAVTDSSSSVMVDATIFALGGASWPRVGSDGKWSTPFRVAGIEVADFASANCAAGIAWSSVMRERFGGEPIKNAVFSAGGVGVRGDAVITDFGLEGGPIYAHSRTLREQLGSKGQAIITIDLHPDLDLVALTDRLSKRRTGASAASWLSSARLAPVVVSLLREATQNQIPSDPAAVAELVKNLPIHVTELASLERAISSAGGVTAAELDENFMIWSKPGVFVAGEMIDWEAPTGGYLLQACFSSGVAAARGAIEWLELRT